MSPSPLRIYQLNVIHKKRKEGIESQTSISQLQDRANILPKGKAREKPKLRAGGEDMIPEPRTVGSTMATNARRDGILHIKKHIKKIDSSKTTPHQPARPVVDVGLGCRALHSLHHLNCKTGSGLLSQPDTLLLNILGSNNRSSFKAKLQSI